MKQPLVTPKSDENDKDLNELITFYNETLGFCPNSVRTMHHRPRIAYAFIEMNKAVMENQGKVTSALKRFIAYISSQATGCRYCEAHTIIAAERYGASQEQMDNIWAYRTHPSFNEAERAALDFSLAASQVPNAVNDDIAERLRQHWTEGEIVEITGVVALFGYLNRWNDSMGTQLEGAGVEGGEKLLAKDQWKVGKHAY
ncbi:MAG: putative peroxidase-related enzyme [Lentimonas sp.]|jgi:uncharacterized peroxidase-related enzyme